MPERDGKDQEEDSPKQAGSCWFALRRPSGLVGNLHTCWCGSREFDSYQSRICVFSFVTESVGT